MRIQKCIDLVMDRQALYFAVAIRRQYEKRQTNNGNRRCKTDANRRQRAMNM
jgi:hypothetical protein